MKSDCDNLPIPLIGIEAEVLGWDYRDRFEVVEDLKQLGRIPKSFDKPQHKWHCSCHICSGVLHNAILPVQFVSQKDATLPEGS